MPPPPIQVSETMEARLYALVPTATSPWLSYRVLPADEPPVALNGLTIEGNAHIELEPGSYAASIIQVDFYLDDVFVRTEASAPYGFASDTGGVLDPWFTTDVGDGVHVIRAEVIGPGLSVTASFTVDNSILEPPPDPGETQFVTTITKDNITWNFSTAVEAGQFVNGDWFVIAPVTVSSVSPAWDGSRGGSQVNPKYVNDQPAPSNGNRQGFDNIMGYFAESVRVTYPYIMNPGDSLISTWSWRVGEPGAPITTATLPNVPRPCIRYAACLTCLATVPPAGTFRPPYAGTQKPLYNTSTMLDLSTLPTWDLSQLHTDVDDFPSISSVKSNIERLHMDFRGWWREQYWTPDANMQSYSRDHYANDSDAMFFLISNIGIADKTDIAIHLIQHGIDQWGVHESAPDVDFGDGAGGHCNGRRICVTLAGHLLGVSTLKRYWLDDNTDIDSTGATVQIARDAQGVYWRERRSNTRADPGNTSYRKNPTSATWYAHCILVRVLGLQTEWNHDDSLVYQDQFAAEAAGFDPTKPEDRGWHYWHYEVYVNTNGGLSPP